jgi:hypothetical protein
MMNKRNRVKIRLTVPIFMTSNTDLEELLSGVSANHSAATQRRTDVITIGGDNIELWQYSCYLAICEGLLDDIEGLHPSRDKKDAALAWFTTNLNRIRDGSPSMLRDICELFHSDNPADLARDLALLITHPAAPDFPPCGGVMPRIYSGVVPSSPAKILPEIGAKVAETLPSTAATSAAAVIAFRNDRGLERSDA